ncbi:flagellar biosynthesis protein FlhF [Massilibacterium senegalense]|uniref:flagellar biosynthesis protein FlhF n=1 Tax=Massilibacterium senegalense TaxID=1632858 RepID=UPI000781A64D|nr:flagellar biosynthesis protein FlhF [Massilibacterium senegalense]
MKVKKYIAPTMAEASEKIKKELGKDAIILNSKVVYTGGFLGFFKKKNIEVIAALDAEKDIPMKSVLKEKKVKKNNGTNGKDGGETDLLLHEMQELKSIVTHLKTKVTDYAQYPQSIQKIYLQLLNQEVPEEWIQRWIEELLEKEPALVEENIGIVRKQLKQYLLQELTSFSYEGLSFQKKYVSLLGPTGVGKTTTLAKLAAICSLQKQKKVAMITTDTYRIAAVEQLKTYAQILNVPIEVAYNIDDFKRAKETFQHHDIVFIDTAGRNFRDEHYVKELKTLIDFDEEMETFLVLALTSKPKDMKEVYEQFSERLDINRIIFSKLDETSSIGGMIDFMFTFSRGISYVTTGQNVPDDMIEATPQYIIQQLLKGESEE